MAAASGGGQLRPEPVLVRVPATSANLGPGYDSFGLALGLHDTVTLGVCPAGVRVAVTGEGAQAVRRDEDNLVVRAALAAFDRMGVTPGGLELACENRIPHGRGLGSSAAAIVAGIVAARALVVDGPARLDEAGVLGLATALEGHPDNVAACLLGGFTVAWTDTGGVHAVRTEPAPGIAAVVFVPPTAVSTAHARGLLPDTVPHADAARNAARAALLVQALSGRADLLLAATEDRLHQDYRAPAMPGSAALVRVLRAEGVAAVVSGAGPAVLALVPAGDAERVRTSLAGRAGPVGSGFVGATLALEPAGAVVAPVALGAPAASA
jgi:homoserine kinase